MSSLLRWAAYIDGQQVAPHIGWTLPPEDGVETDTDTDSDASEDITFFDEETLSEQVVRNESPEIIGYATLDDVQEEEIRRQVSADVKVRIEQVEAEAKLLNSYLIFSSIRNSPTFQDCLENIDRIKEVYNDHKDILIKMWNNGVKGVWNYLKSLYKSALHKMAGVTSSACGGAVTWMASCSGTVIGMAIASGLIVYIVLPPVAEYLYGVSEIPVRAVFVFGLGCKLITSETIRVFNAITGVADPNKVHSPHRTACTLTAL